MTNVKTPSDLVKRLRETASKGVSVWGDLQMEAAKEIEILTAEREAYASAMDRMKAAQPAPQPAQEPTKFLANGTRFKVNFDGDGGVYCFAGHEKELQGRLVALVDATDNCHMQSAQPVAPLTDGDIRELADCIVATLDGRKGVINLDFDDDLVEEIMQEMCDTIRVGIREVK